MSGYDALRAMRKGDESDPEFEAWKNNIVKPEPIPISDDQHQMHIDLTNDDLFEDDGTMDMNGSIFPTLREIKESGDKDLYNLAAEQGSTDIFEFDDDPPERIGTPYPDRETTQTTIDAHAAGGDNVWQRGQTARQQAAMARDAQQARDLARPYRMAPQVAYKQAQEEQNMEPTQKSAMLELPSISSMIKGKREDPRENLFEFKKRDPRIDLARENATHDANDIREIHEDLEKNPIRNREIGYSSTEVLSAPSRVGTGDSNYGVDASTWGSRNVGMPASQPHYRQMAQGAEANARIMDALSRGYRLASYIVPGSSQYDTLKEIGYTDEEIEKFKNMLSSRAFGDIESADNADDTAKRLREAQEESKDWETPLAARRNPPSWPTDS